MVTMDSTLSSHTQAIIDADEAEPKLTREEIEAKALNELLEFISAYCDANGITFVLEDAKYMLKNGKSVAEVIDALRDEPPPPRDGM